MYTIEDGNVYFESIDGKMKRYFGIANKTETNRIDANTVEDIAYIFDLELGDYVENTAIPRVTRIDPLPVPEPSEIDVIGMQLVEKDLQILELQSENEVIGQQLVDMDLRLLQGGL